VDRSAKLTSLTLLIRPQQTPAGHAPVGQRVQPQTRDALGLTPLAGPSGAEVAARLGMPVTSVSRARSNVPKLLEV
jgi:hypothetical protein